MKKLTLPLLMLLFVSFAGCDNKAKKAEEMDKKEAAKVDSVSADVNKSADELSKEGDQVEKEVNDLLKD
jgi:uncharacterized lipoprotein NlpE involved in copper resistance